MTRSIFPPILLALWSAIVLLAACGGNAEEPKRTAELDDSFKEELRLLVREEVEAARLSPNDKVHIVLAGSGATTKLVRVDPDEKRVCKHPEAACGRQVRWILQGAIPQDWYVELKKKSTDSNPDCFAEPAPLKKGHTTELSSEPAPDCQYDGATWAYSATLYDGDDTVKGMVDPLVIVNWSP